MKLGGFINNHGKPFEETLRQAQGERVLKTINLKLSYLTIYTISPG